MGAGWKRARASAKATQVRPEDGLQKLCVSWLMLERPDIMFWAVKNEGKRSFRTTAWMKSMGMRVGVGDLTVVLPDNRCGQIELKIRPNKLTEPQEQFRDECQRRGIPWAECTSFEKFQSVIRDWCGDRRKAAA